MKLTDSILCPHCYQECNEQICGRMIMLACPCGYMQKVSQYMIVDLDEPFIQQKLFHDQVFCTFN